MKSLKVISGLTTLSKKSRYRTVYLADENVRGPINVVNTGGINMYTTDTRRCVCWVPSINP